MRHWVRDALYTLRADNDRSALLTTLLKLTSLIFTFDKSSALKCIKQARFNARHARVQEFMHVDGRYVLDDIVNLLDGTQQNCISAGLLALRYVWYRNARLFAALRWLQAYPQVCTARGLVRFL